MAFTLEIIASVDESASPTPIATVSGERNTVLPSRPVVYVSREFCIQHRLRNATVALSHPGPDLLYASIKIYSKDSVLFRNDPRFPDKLVSNASGAGSASSYPVVVSNLLWWEIMRQQQEHDPVQEPLPTQFHQDLTMPATQAPLFVNARVLPRLGNATAITLATTDPTAGPSLTVQGADITQTLSGQIASLHGWIVFKSPHGTQSFRITQITTTDVDQQDIGIISDTTLVKYAQSYTRVKSPLSSPSTIIPASAVSPSIAKDAWASAVGSGIGGYNDILSRIINYMSDFFEDAIRGIERSEAPASEPDLSPRFKSSRKGMVLCGRPGTGKSALAASIAQHSGMPYTVLNCPDVFKTGVEAKLFATLLHLVDSINTHPAGNKIFIIGYEQRLSVLEIVSKDLPMDPEQRPIILRKIAKITHGFVPTDLQSLCTESALLLISRMATGAHHPVIDFSFFEQALKTIRPSGMGESLSKIPVVTFNNLFGVEDAIADLRVSVIEPFHNPGKYLEMGIAPPRGLLVYGPPGVGKTMLCCALAEELGINFMLVESSQIRSKVVGESEQNISRIFAQAKANAPCILFIDQIDILAPSRGTTHTSENSGDRIVTGLLTEMDGFFASSAGKGAEVDVLVLAATNRPEVIDSAILRPGRLDQMVYIPVPDQKTRQAILTGYMSRMPLEISTEEMEQLAASTEGYSGADLENLCREAALICLREDISNAKIGMTHLEAAKSVSKPSLKGYEGKHIFHR
ncbi:hypothetical protein BGZ99_003233 [Dissophora globulifera]|uniref:AAA+ ATPase domain-containing protein n=1 Tax=Dissophora globulifera TaxID=979702 RepID=A0A9P6UWM2_9FUNG|nr:hypothetical protein BGZ99_003233 [Dissophora globulifera]